MVVYFSPEHYGHDNTRVLPCKIDMVSEGKSREYLVWCMILWIKYNWLAEKGFVLKVLVINWNELCICTILGVSNKLVNRKFANPYISAHVNLIFQFLCLSPIRTGVILRSRDEWNYRFSLEHPVASTFTYNWLITYLKQ